MEKGHRPVGEQAVELMAIPSGARVLDVGCGSGWATRLMAEKAMSGRVVGIDIADEMISIASATTTTPAGLPHWGSRSASSANVEFRVASAERLPFPDADFTHAFSMESLYYYADVLVALKEIRRVLAPGGLFVTVLDLYKENQPSGQWVEQLKVPVHYLSVWEYRSLFEGAGFVNVHDQRLYDPTPVPEDYTGGSFNTREDYLRYKETGSLMLSGEVEV